MNPFSHFFNSIPNSLSKIQYCSRKYTVTITPKKEMKIISWNLSRVLTLLLALGFTYLVCHVLFIILHSESSNTGTSRVFTNVHKQKENITTVYYTKDKLGNFEPPEEIIGTGPGEGGKPYTLIPYYHQVDVSKSMQKYGMNQPVSDLISLERTIPDTRQEECKHWNYPENMGLNVSVVLVFHNEGFSTLIRTVHTVIKRSPAEILGEVLLVDDFSSFDGLKFKLDNYIKRFNGKVRIIRNSEREGLIRSRSTGARQSTGDVIVFLDAHCEVNRNWLLPLLAPIYRDRTVMTVPFIDRIDLTTFEYRAEYPPGKLFRGIFEWGMFYKEIEVSPEMEAKRQYKSAPYKSPTHAGGLFAIDRQYFLSLGTYDPGLLVWGGENFELSFKVWQCGGSIEWVPCSRVGHVYRDFTPYSSGKLGEKKKGSLILMNYKRVIETWFDEKHKEFFYTREPMARYLDVGSLSEQLAVKKQLKCKSFQWFMDNVSKDVLLQYPEPPPNMHWGEFRNEGTQTCMDTMGERPPSIMGLFTCHGAGNNQLLRLSTLGQLGIGERCVDYEENEIKLTFCPLGKIDGPWRYNEESKTMQHLSTEKCLVARSTISTTNTSILTMRDCDAKNKYHQWIWNKIKP